MAGRPEKKKKKLLGILLAVFIVSGGFFVFSDVPSAFGASRLNCIPLNEGFKECWDSGGVKVNGDNIFEKALKGLLYAIFVLFGWFTSVAVTIFGWAINPEHISGPGGFFNRPVVYELWKFIRDFFNLFFILVLLYIAFTLVFQIQKNFKQALLSLVLAALLVNFSFPVSRFMIDVTNVPMYFFANEMFGNNNQTQTSGAAFGSALGASQLKGILIPGSDKEEFDTQNTSISRILAGIVFLFIFSITLLVLAVMFVIRLVALLILVIFSAVGFAASIVPGLGQYSKMWWESFWKYALFGPAAMLMLLVATRFFAEIGKAGDPTFQNFQEVATNTTTSADMSFMASMAMFSIPIVMLWMTIGLAQKFAVVGAASVSGKGKQFGKWLAKKPYDNPLGRGVGGGIKERYQESRVGRFISGPSKTEAFARGVVGTGTVKGELAKINRQAVMKGVKEAKDKEVSSDVHLQNLKSSDPIKRQVAAISLAEGKNIRNAEVLADSLKAVGDNQDFILKILDNAKPEAIKGMDVAKHATVQQTFFQKDPRTGRIMTDDKGQPRIAPRLQDAYDAYNGKLKNEGNMQVRVVDELSRTGFKADDISKEAQAARSAVYKKIFDKVGAEDMVKQKDLYKDPGFKQYIQNERGPQFIQAAMEKAMEKGGKEAFDGWLAMSGEDTPAPKIEIAEGYRTRKT